jgi:putative ABC transport system ATP-binding protein/lipoprotein-releasing system ATP-binding protein
MSEASIISVEGVTKNYTIDKQVLKAVDGVSFDVSKGEMVSIIGHSGSGKTTLLSLIGGLTKPDAGRVLIDRQDVWSMDDPVLSEFRNRKISFIYQFASLIPTLTCLENIMLPMAFGNSGTEVGDYARELLALVGLKDKEKSLPAHLSGGQQRRIAIARAFINRPEIVLADEPTGDLDEDTEKEVLALFRNMNSEHQMTFVIVTHNNDIAAQAGRQFRMVNGVLTKLA